MAETIPVPTSHGDHAHEAMSFWSKYVFSTDHKMIAMQYMFTGIFMGLIGGFMAYAFRMQLAFPGLEVPGYGLVSPADYNALVTNHGTIMIFWVAMPVLIAAFGNYLIPLMLGCDDMVFPRINRLSYQVFLLSAIVLICSFFVEGGGFAGAWTAYPHSRPSPSTASRRWARRCGWWPWRSSSWRSCWVASTSSPPP